MRVAVLFVAALGWESRQLLRGLALSRPATRGGATLWTGSCALGDVALVQTGIGGDRADAGLRFALEHVAPEVVLSTGCAGALDPAMATGDLVVADDLIDVAGERIATSPRWRERYLRAADRAGVRSMTGVLLSSTEVLLAAQSKREQASRSRAVAVEMEGMALARRAEALGIEFAAARVILDPASVTLPVEILGVTGADGSTNPLRLMKAVVLRPSLVHDLVSLGSMAARCRKALSAVHARLLLG